MNRRAFIRRAGWVSTGLIFVPKLLRADNVTNFVDGQGIGLGQVISITPSGSGGGGGGWVLIGSGIVAASTDQVSVTTSPYNTTGASLIVIVETANTAKAPTDSKGNTYTLRADGTQSFGNAHSYIYACESPITDVSQTFSVAGANAPALCVMAFSGGIGTFDQSNHGFNDLTTTVQPGSVTPTTNGELIITGIGYGVGTSASVDSGFTPLNSAPGSHSTGGAMAYLVQAVAAAINPTWTVGAADKCTAVIATFKK